VGIETVGVIGLGTTGRAVARRLLRQGREVSVHDRDPWKVADMTEEGARPARIPADAAEPADLVFVHMPNQTAIEEVLFECGGVGETLRDGGIAVISGPTSVAFLHSVAGRLGEFGISTVEAIVSGDVGRTPVSMLVGCDPEVLDTIAPVLGMVADDVAHAGPVGSVATMRLLVTRLLALQSVAPPVSADGRTPDDRGGTPCAVSGQRRTRRAAEPPSRLRPPTTTGSPPLPGTPGATLRSEPGTGEDLRWLEGRLTDLTRCLGRPLAELASEDVMTSLLQSRVRSCAPSDHQVPDDVQGHLGEQSCSG